MMDTITFVVPGDLKGKGRPRVNRFSGSVYTPEKTRMKEGIVANFAYAAMKGRAPFSGALSVEVTTIMPVPKSWSLKRKAAALSGEEKPAKKPDIDNCLKLIFDAINTVVFQDDSQIVQLVAEKKYGEKPETIVTVTEIGLGIEGE
jgi:Holliday junction resolvase RusA-like endonuclease